MTTQTLSNRAIIGNFYRHLEQEAGQSWINQVSMLFNSDQGSETYAWLGQTPVMREWLGGRQAKGFSENKLTIHIRELVLNFTLVTKASPNAMPVLDQLAAQITTCLLADRKLGGLCKTLRFQETTEINTTEDGEKPVCSLVLRCLVWYRQVDFMPDRLAI